jgi:hypothetical protein
MDSIMLFSREERQLQNLLSALSLCFIGMFHGPSIFRTEEYVLKLNIEIVINILIFPLVGKPEETTGKTKT